MTAVSPHAGTMTRVSDGECLTEKNWHVYAMRAYRNASSGEFVSDMMHFKYVKKLVTQYAQTGRLKHRLILNHMILLRNVLGEEALARILFLKVHEHMRVVAPFMIMLGIMPSRVYNVRDVGVIYTDDIQFDPRVVGVLRSERRK